MFTFLPHISRIILFSAFGFVCGVFIASFFTLSTDVVLFCMCIVSITSFAFFYKNTYVWSILIFFGFFGFGFYHSITYSSGVNWHVVSDRGDVNGVARVVLDVEQKTFYSFVYVQFEEEDFITQIKDEKHTFLERGDVLTLSCMRSVPESYEDFDYRSYLAMRGVYLVCADPVYDVVGHEKDIFSSIARFRITMEHIVNEIIPAPESALANGLLFGGSARLSQELQDDFSATGMTHIVAVSGYNVSIIIAVVMGCLIFMGLYRQWAVFGAIIAVIFFVALIGFPSSGVRAAIMGIMVLIAATFGRVTHAYAAIIFSGAIMLFFNPLLLRYDIGFQLSFLATLGIVAVYPIMECVFIHRNMAFGIVEVLLLTLSAQVFVVPIIIYHFHTFSFVSLLVNVLVLPIIPVTMLMIFLLVVSSFVYAPLAMLFGWAGYMFLTYEVFIISFFADLRFGSMYIPHFSVVWMCVYYAMIVGFLLYINSKRCIYEK
jgi:competence protein ComEC